MTQLALNFTSFTTLGALVGHLLLGAVVLVFALTRGNRLILWISRNALVLSFVIALIGVLGSLTYSEIIGFDPCTLCWVQRIFLFPQVFILGLGLYRKDSASLDYSFLLSIVGALVAFYHWISQSTGFSITECTAVGGDCSKVFFMGFGYITIPLMSLTIFAYLIVIYIIYKKHYVIT